MSVQRSLVWRARIFLYRLVQQSFARRPPVTSTGAKFARTTYLCLGGDTWSTRLACLNRHRSLAARPRLRAPMAATRAFGHPRASMEIVGSASIHPIHISPGGCEGTNHASRHPPPSSDPRGCFRPSSGRRDVHQLAGGLACSQEFLVVGELKSGDLLFVLCCCIAMLFGLCMVCARNAATSSSSVLSRCMLA